MFPAQSWNSSQTRIGFSVRSTASAICAAAVSGSASAAAIVAQKPRNSRRFTPRCASSVANHPRCALIRHLLPSRASRVSVVLFFASRLDAQPQRPGKWEEQRQGGEHREFFVVSSHCHLQSSGTLQGRWGTLTGGAEMSATRANSLTLEQRMVRSSAGDCGRSHA